MTLTAADFAQISQDFMRAADDCIRRGNRRASTHYYRLAVLNADMAKALAAVEGTDSEPALDSVDIEVD